MNLELVWISKIGAMRSKTELKLHLRGYSLVNNLAPKSYWRSPLNTSTQLIVYFRSYAQNQLIEFTLSVSTAVILAVKPLPVPAWL
jgi:hypothetical protein